MQVNLEWFEAVCQELSRNPVSATKSIEAFRDSDVAVEACKSFILSNSASFMAKFQAVSVLQISYLSRWTQFSKHEHDSTKDMMCHMISECISGQSQPNGPPSYLINKLIQVFVSFWKHDWLECERSEKEQFFQIISTLLKTSEHMKSGTILLESVLEEFSTKTFAESNLSFEKHMQIKKTFQSTDLQRVFILSVESISVVFQAISSDGNSGMQTHFHTLAELLKLLVEVISWDFNLSSTVAPKRGGGDDEGRRGGAMLTQYNKLPREWSAYLIQPTFIDSIYGMYDQLLLFGAQQAAQSSGGTGSEAAARDVETCLLETRNLVLCLSSMNGEIFAAPSEQVAMASYIVSYSIKLVEGGSSSRLDLQSAISSGQMSLTAPSYESGGVRYRELELFLSTVFRLLSNFKVSVLSQMSNFTAMLVTLSAIAQENSSELLAITQDMMSRITAITAQAGRNSALYEQQLRCAYDPPVLDTWRGEVLTTVVDIWTALLEDSTVQELVSCSSANRDPQFRSFAVGMSEQLFPALFESLLNVYIFESVLSCDEEEDEDDVVIAARSVEDVLMGVCMIGRVSFVRNSSLLCTFLTSAANEMTQLFSAQQNGQGAHSTSNLIVLEKLRITLLFTSYLFVDNFHENSEEVDHEAASIGALVLDAFCSDCAQTVAALNQTVQSVVNLLSFQMTILGTPNGVCNDLLSPMLLQLVFRFVTEYLARYVDADSSVYSREVLQTLPQLTQIHGAEFNTILDQLLSAVPHILVYLPLETELVVNIAETLTALSASSNAHRLQFVMSLPSITTVAQIVTNQYQPVSGSAITVPSRLSALGNSTFFEAIGALFVKARSEAFFTQLCTSVYAQCSSIVLSQGHDAEALMERSLSSLSGLARCPSGLDPVLHSLFDGCFPVLKASIHKYAHSDVLLKLYLGLLRDFAEVQLSRLNNNSCFELYKNCYELLQLYAKRFASSDLHSASMDEEAVHFKNESCWVLLELLNHLSSRDFSFSEDCSDALNRSFEEEVASVLLFGLQTMTPVITVDILRAFPLTADKYFSFVAFVAGTYMGSLVQWLNGLQPEEGRRRLFDIVQHLLWGPGSYDAATARQALQALQSIAINQHKAMQNPQRVPGLSPALHSEVLLLVMDRLLEIVLLPQGREHDLAWDRVDALGNTLIAFIALDTQRFQQVGSALVSRHAQQSVQQTLFEGLGKLSTSRHVALDSVEKANRQLFVANFREFVTCVKGLNLK